MAKHRRNKAGPGIALSESLDQEDIDTLQEGDRHSIQFFAGGTWHHPSYGAMTFDDKFTKSIVSEFNEAGNPRPIDVNHQSMLNYRTYDEGKAFGWIHSLSANDDGKIFGEVEWTRSGADAIKSGEYRFISPEFSVDYTDKQSGEPTGSPKLFAAALTNRPFLEGMERAAAAETMEDPSMQKKIALGEALGSLLGAWLEGMLAELGDEAELPDVLMQASEAAGLSVEELDALLAGEQLCPPVEALEALAGFFGGPVEDLISAGVADGCEYELPEEPAEEPEMEEAAMGETKQALSEATKRAEKAEARLAAIEAANAALADARKDEIIRAHVEAGRVTPAMLPSVKKFKALHTAEELDKFLSEIGVQIHTSNNGTAKDGSDAKALSDSDKAVSHKFGIPESTIMTYGNVRTAFFDGTAQLVNGRRVKFSDVKEGRV